MNVAEINPGTLETLGVYIESTIILTLITSWVIIALQDYSSFHRGGPHIIERVAWPVFFGYRQLKKMMDTAKKLLDRSR